MTLNRLRIGTRLGGSLAIGLALLALITVAAALALGNVANRARELMADPLAKERLAQEWVRHVSAGVARTTALARSSDPTLETVFAEDIKATSARTDEVYDALLKVADEDEKAMLMKSAELRLALLGARQQVLDAKKQGKADVAERLIGQQAGAAASVYLASVQAFLDAQIKTIDAAGAQIQADASHGLVLLAGLGAASLLLGAALAWVLSRSITLPLAQAAKVARAVAGGDLTQRFDVSGRDEVAELLRAMKEMQDHLVGLVAQVRAGLASVGSSSEEIARGNAELSQRTEQTASSLQKTSGAMLQLTATVAQTADSARTANQLASSASAVAQRGGEVVAQVVTTMDQINTSSRKIADIISTIDGIAFQTNILALNAAVEAARAGEQGRGFAVVASEVRSLAGRSAEAAREIKSLIGASVEKVESGSRLVADAGATMTEIVASVQRVTDIIGEISAAATEQSSGIGQVNAAVGQLDQMTQQNAALVEESAAAAESLKAQAQRLSLVLTRFRIDADAAPQDLAYAAPAAAPAHAARQLITRAAQPAALARKAAPAVAKVLAKVATKVQAQPPTKAPLTPIKAAAPVAVASASGNDSDWETF